jgi:hypothetical protein
VAVATSLKLQAARKEQADVDLFTGAALLIQSQELQTRATHIRSYLQLVACSFSEGVFL